MKPRARNLIRLTLAAVVLFGIGGCVYDPYYHRTGVVYDDEGGRTYYDRAYYDDDYSPGYYYAPAYAPYYGYGYSPWYPWGVGLGFTYYGGGGHHHGGGHHWSGGHHSGGSHHGHH